MPFWDKSAKTHNLPTEVSRLHYSESMSKHIMTAAMIHEAIRQMALPPQRSIWWFCQGCMARPRRISERLQSLLRAITWFDNQSPQVVRLKAANIPDTF